MDRSIIYGCDWNDNGLRCIMAIAMVMAILTVTSTAKVAENIEKIGLQITHQKLQSSGSDTMLEILNDCIKFLKK